MSIPQVQSITGPRRSSRRPKSTNAGFSEGDQPATDSGLSSPDPGYSGATNSDARPQTDGQKLRKKSHGAKKTQTTAKPESEPASNHHRSSPQPSLAYPSQRQGTPIKQAYAGPTFHSSPAPSALPMPSFYSKSVPSTASTKTPEIVEEQGANKAAEVKLEDTAAVQIGVTEKQESTPLDFLFEAARLARDTPRAESPANRSAKLFAPEDSPLRRSPAPREGGETVFPFDLDGNGSSVASMGPVFATPYKERMTALRSSSASPSISSSALDEDERRNKTEALKQMLMNNAQSSAQRSSSASPHPSDHSNPFNARALDLRNSNVSPHEKRHRSGPCTPVPSSNVADTHQCFASLPPPVHGTRMNGSPMHRPTSSHLRRQYRVQDHESPAELASDHNTTASSTSTAQNGAKHTQSSYQSSNHSSAALPHSGQTPNHSSAHSAQQLEDDLRRVLKLNLTSRG